MILSLIHILGAVQATVPSEDMMGAVTEMEHRRNMLLVACIICGLSMAMIISYLLTRDLKKIQRDVDFIAAGHEDESIEETGFLEVRSIVQRFNEILGRMQTLEDSRQEFVSNVSHELKTPMTSMKVLADSLIQQGDQVPAELYREFMQDIVAEIDRENVIISDLLSLVKLDKKAAPVSYTHLKGLIIISAGNNVIRFVPPLVIEKEHVDEMISILEDCIA